MSERDTASLRRGGRLFHSSCRSPAGRQGRLIDFPSLNIQPHLCSQELQGRLGVWVVLLLEFFKIDVSAGDKLVS